MSRRRNHTDRNILAALACALLAGTSAPARAADTTYERLVNPEPQNWLSVHHDYTSQRFSALDAINKSNVKNLKLAFAVALGGSGNESLEATPLVEDGFMYMVDSWGIVSKIDVRSGTAGSDPVADGSEAGEAGPQSRRSRCGTISSSRSPAMPGGSIATDKETGKIVWDKNLARPGRPRPDGGAARPQGRAS